MTENNILKTIYPSVVTYAGNWRKMVGEVKKLRLKEISLFLTGAGVNERKKIYAELAKTSVKRIPHVHARHDMKQEEFSLLVNTDKTRAFTIPYQFIPCFKNSKYRKIIFSENNYRPREISELKMIALIGGICVDLSHFEQFRRHTPKLDEVYQIAQKMYKVGCNHISAVQDNGWSRHYARDKHEFDYLSAI